MPVDCQRSTSGGKGNTGMFIERDSNMCAAGLPTAQPDENVAKNLEHYLMKDEVDALINDAIIPPPKPRPLPPLRRPLPLDKRNAGLNCDMAKLINPPLKSKFITLVDDFKDTVYSSYWKKPLGKYSDPTPMLPEGFDKTTTFGKKTEFDGRLYDIVMPKVPYPDKTPDSKKPGYQLKRNYCSPPFNPDLFYGHRYYSDKVGKKTRCCLTDDQLVLGNGGHCIVNTIQSNFLDVNRPKLGKALTPNGNINEVPEGYAFGKLKPQDNLPECLTTCKINPNVAFIRKCLKHYNTLRKSLSTKYLPTFFRNFYLNLKYFDKENSGWLPNEVVYKLCGSKYIRFDPSLIEPLLSMWNAFDGKSIEYKTFVYCLNYSQPPLDLPKIPDVPKECLHFLTTYQEMVMLGQEADTRKMAGLPSGRYFDKDYPITPNKCCKADRTYLPHETDVKACIGPSILTNVQVSHRDFYQKREPNEIRRIFEAAGETFTDESFNAVWEEAKKYHSEGWVCVETFRKALENPKE